MATDQPRAVQLVAVASPMSASAGFPAWWEPLFKTCGNPSVFLSPAWIQSWTEVYGGEFEGFWVRWECRGTVVGGCLVVTRTIWKRGLPAKIAFLNATGESALRTPKAEYNDILCLPGYETAVIAEAVLLLQRHRWALFSVDGYCPQALIAQVVSRLPAAAKTTKESTANFVDLSELGKSTYEASLTGNAGNLVRRNRRLYESALNNFEIVRAHDLGEAIAFLDQLSVLHNARWQSKGKTGSFASSEVVDFHRRLIKRLWPLGGVDLVSVRANGQIVGYLYNFTSEQKVYFFQSGFAYEPGSKRSPGLLIHALCIEDYRLKGYREYDFMAGTSQYKRTLAKRERPLCWTIVYRNSPWPKALWFAQQLKRNLNRLTA